jgi:hypothetical protein
LVRSIGADFSRVTIAHDAGYPATFSADVTFPADVQSKTNFFALGLGFLVSPSSDFHPHGLPSHHVQTASPALSAIGAP